MEINGLNTILPTQPQAVPESPVVDPEVTEESAKAKGAVSKLNNLDDRHFNAVADIRLRISHFDNPDLEPIDPALFAPPEGNNGKAYEKFLAEYTEMYDQWVAAQTPPEEPSPPDPPEPAETPGEPTAIAPLATTEEPPAAQAPTPVAPQEEPAIEPAAVVPDAVVPDPAPEVPLIDIAPIEIPPIVLPEDPEPEEPSDPPEETPSVLEELYAPETPAEGENIDVTS